MLVGVDVVRIVPSNPSVGPRSDRYAVEKATGQHSYGATFAAGAVEKLLQIGPVHRARADGRSRIVGCNRKLRLRHQRELPPVHIGDVVFGHVVAGGMKQSSGDNLGGAGKLRKVRRVELDDITVAPAVENRHSGCYAGGFDRHHFPRR